MRAFFGPSARRWPSVAAPVTTAPAEAARNRRRESGRGDMGLSVARYRKRAPRPYFPPVYFTHDTCVIRWLSDANDTAALVAKRGVALAGNVASVASPTRKTLKSFARFS